MATKGAVDIMAKTANFQTYDELDVQFLYPNNWTALTQTLDRGTYMITVDSPEGSFWTLAIYPKGVDLDNAAQELLATLKVEYQEVEEHEVCRYVADRELSGYEINFYYLDMVCEVRALKYEDDERGYVIFWQTCDRLALTDEAFSQTDVLNVMTHSLITNITGQDLDLWEDALEDTRTEEEIREEEDREERLRIFRNARMKENAERESRGEAPLEADGFRTLRLKTRDGDQDDYDDDSQDGLDRFKWRRDADGCEVSCDSEDDLDDGFDEFAR